MVKQFDVFENASNRTFPWLLNVQSDLLDEMSTRVVVPLVREGTMRLPATRLNPTFRIGGEAVVMVTQQMGAIGRGALRKRVVSFENRRTEIIGAIDFLLSGV